MKPTKSFCEGSLLPLMKILEINLYVTTLKLDGAAIDSTQKPAAGNGNSNARILGHVLKNNSVISTVDVSNTGLDDEGITEISQDSSITLMNLSTIRTVCMHSCLMCCCFDAIKTDSAAYAHRLCHVTNP